MELCRKGGSIPLGICDVGVGVKADAALEGAPTVVVLHLQAMRHGVLHCSRRAVTFFDLI